MSSSEKYLLDANVFIEANKDYYRLSFFDAFWEWLIKGNEQGKAFSVNAVYDEIKERQDMVSTWAENNKSIFIKQNNESIKQFTTVTNYINGLDKDQSQKDAFLKSTADIELIAHALADNQYTIVTHEKYIENENKHSKIKIPNVCKSFNLNYFNTFDMLEKELKKDKYKFILKKC